EKDGKREEFKRDTLARLMGHIRQEIRNPGAKEDDQPMPQPGAPKSVPGSGPAAKLYEERAGYANYYFNKLERDRLLAAYKKHADLTGTQREWVITAAGEVRNKNASVEFTINSGDKEVVNATVGGVDYKLEPLDRMTSRESLLDPRGSGGALLALYHWQQLM